MSRARRARRLLAGALVIPLVAALAAPSAAQQTPPGSAPRKADESIQAEQRKLQQTEQQIREERRKAADARARETSVLAELDQIENRLADKQREMVRLDTRIRKAQGDVASLRTEIRHLEVQRSGQEQALARRLLAMYKVRAQGGALPIILSGEDPVSRAVTVRHLTSLAALDARLIQEYRGTSGRLEDRRGREETRQRELASLRSDAEREQTEVDREAAKRRALLARVRDERVYHERMVGELTEAARRLEAFIRDLQSRQRRLARIPPPKSVPDSPSVGFGMLRGRLPWPTDGRIVSAFGAQVHPRFGTRTFRNGVDIAAGEGRDIAAVYAGHVIYTGWFKGYGNLVILDHDNDYYTLYAHIADIHVREGDDVKQGQRIGTVGDTGSLEGPRLYFEVRFQGKPQDPEQWLRQRG
ncbi:MAG TPA: peptidoglycan DD-metalloendopeptidase family protein [Methylomirabilota bacterium]|jgi:septal ring factor EnvC (AmiA/AmiB activator)|nr:peptidoglycan DD-metalloendopeptidase family protein [Methylomirabilota bacterium]